MNRKQRISKCLDELQNSHCDWWPDIAARNRITLNDLEAKGYIHKKEDKTPSGNPSYEITKEGGEFVAKNPAYLRPSFEEILHQRVDTISYLGKRIMVFDDDPGQQYYFYYKGSCVGCGAYNPDYEGFIKEYLYNKISFICPIDTPEYPLMRATLEYRKSKTGHMAKYLILSDREEGKIWEPFYVGEKRASNESCIEMARYIISIIKHQSKMTEMKETSDINTLEDSH